MLTLGCDGDGIGDGDDEGARVGDGVGVGRGDGVGLGVGDAAAPHADSSSARTISAGRIDDALPTAHRSRTATPPCFGVGGSVIGGTDQRSERPASRTR